jgi:hypothetical protein
MPRLVIDPVARTICLRDRVWRFEWEPAAATAAIDIDGRRFELHELTWRQKRNVARAAQKLRASDEALGALLLDACLPPRTVPPIAADDREALAHLAGWLMADGSAVPWEPAALARVTLEVCRAAQMSPQALDDISAADVESMWEVVRLDASPAAPAFAADSAPSGVKKIVIVPDPAHRASSSDGAGSPSPSRTGVAEPDVAQAGVLALHTSERAAEEVRTVPHGSPNDVLHVVQRGGQDRARPEVGCESPHSVQAGAPDGMRRDGPRDVRRDDAQAAPSAATAVSHTGAGPRRAVRDVRRSVASFRVRALAGPAVREKGADAVRVDSRPAGSEPCLQHAQPLAGAAPQSAPAAAQPGSDPGRWRFRRVPDSGPLPVRRRGPADPGPGQPGWPFEPLLDERDDPFATVDDQQRPAADLATLGDDLARAAIEAGIDLED